MSRDILVIAMAGIAVLAGIWCWWYENHGPKNAQVSDSATMPSDEPDTKDAVNYHASKSNTVTTKTTADNKPSKKGK